MVGVPGTRDPVHWAGSGRPQPWCWGAVSSHGGFILEANGSDWNQFKTNQDFGCDLQVVPWEPSRVLSSAVREREKNDTVFALESS